MSKTKKLLSIALAMLLCLQLLLVPTFAEGEDATGKYTTADSLPTVYGAGESLDDFENVNLSEAETISSTNENTIICYPNKWFGCKFTTVDAETYGVYGSKALKMYAAQNNSGFVIKLNTVLDDGIILGKKLKNKELAYYVNIPAFTVACDVEDDLNNDTRYPDDKYGTFLFPSNSPSQDEAINNTILKNYTVTYYFEDGTKLVKGNESGIYAYKSDGTVSTTGFKGYVSINLENTNVSDYDYLFVRNINKGNLAKSFYLDDFRLVDSDVFIPYGVIDFETAQPYDTDINVGNDSNIGWRVFSAGNPKANFDNTGVAQGTAAFKFKSTKNENVAMKFRLEAVNGTKSELYNGITFYTSIPGSNSSGTPKLSVSLGASWDDTNVSYTFPAIYTYYFEDGSTLVRYGDDGIYPYDKNGEIVQDTNNEGKGFTGYVSLYYDEKKAVSTNRFINIKVLKDDNAALALANSGSYVYLDDFRFCNYIGVADMESGDAYYINDIAVTVQTKKDSVDNPEVMTKLATLGMARNVAGIAALRKVLLENAGFAEKHDVNSDTLKNICDLVALKKKSIV